MISEDALENTKSGIFQPSPWGCIGFHTCVAPNILCQQKTPETRPIIPAFFQRDKLLCRFNLNEIFSFQKPLGNKEAFVKVINAIEAKDQEHSGLKLIIFVLSLIVCNFPQETLSLILNKTRNSRY